ncbi:SSI family serine proteinase inhibitor [Streptomyces sp. NPDC047028]|uniref:SSI family serine proteinase inhibitor n=1 Tax=Streptomyces sp. NPDC047028 TaxID=3155793 RepID=UPI0034113900
MVFVISIARGRVLGPVLAAAVAAVPLAGVGSSAAAAPSPSGAAGLHRPPRHGSGDRLTVVVRHAGPGRDGSYELSCHPDGGRHPNPAGACRMLDGKTRWGRDTFAPVAPGSTCTMIYGGPATAHVTGTWAGRPVDAVYDRSNGCEIGRWDRMVPLLPAMTTTGETKGRV